MKGWFGALTGAALIAGSAVSAAPYAPQHPVLAHPYHFGGGARAPGYHSGQPIGRPASGYRPYPGADLAWRGERSRWSGGSAGGYDGGRGRGDRDHWGYVAGAAGLGLATGYALGAAQGYDDGYYGDNDYYAGPVDQGDYVNEAYAPPPQPAYQDGYAQGYATDYPPAGYAEPAYPGYDAPDAGYVADSYESQTYVQSYGSGPVYVTPPQVYTGAPMCGCW